VLRLFQSIFGGAADVNGRYPERVVDAAIERALDGTDPRLRILRGYRKTLRPLVIHAVDHVVRLVEGLPSPIELSRKGYGADPRLSACFASADHLTEVVNADRALSDFLASTEAGVAERIIALLVTVKQERKVLGVALEGEILKRDVPQITVSFANHRVVDPATTYEETRRLLKRRAFDHLLGIALGRIAPARRERAGLEQQRALLRRKLMTLRSGRWGFDEARGKTVTDVAEIEAQLAGIEEQLQGLGADAGVLQFHLDMLSEVLSRAEQQLWATPITLILDRMNIKQDQARDNALDIRFEEMHSASGRTAILLPVVVPRSELRPRTDLLAEAQRYLA
jgi:hypothetical protein